MNPACGALYVLENPVSKSCTNANLLPKERTYITEHVDFLRRSERSFQTLTSHVWRAYLRRDATALAHEMMIRVGGNGAAISKG